MDNIKKQIVTLYHWEEHIIEELENDVNYIIDNNITDTDIIEHTLDRILDIMFHDTSTLFNKLNNYYETINQEYADEYKLIYKNILD